VTRVEHHLNRLALQLAATDPDQRPNPCWQTIELQHFSRRERVEVSDKDMKTVLMTLDSIEQRSHLACAPPFVPLRKSRAQMQPKDSSLATGKHDFEKRMPRSRGIVPLVIINLLPAEKTDRVILSRGPNWKLRRLRDSLDHKRIRCFLKNDHIRRRGHNRFRQYLLATTSSKTNVVTEQPKGHEVSPDGTTTKYGSPNKTSRP